MTVLPDRLGQTRVAGRAWQFGTGAAAPRLPVASMSRPTMAISALRFMRESR